MTNHLSTIAKLRDQKKDGGGKSEDFSSGRSRTEGNESDYSELSDVDDDAYNNFGEDDNSDVDEDESSYATSDPKSDTTLLLPSLFKDRPPTVWFPYAAFSQRTREQGRERTYELADDKSGPLLFRSNHTIVCLGGALKRSGFRRLASRSRFAQTQQRRLRGRGTRGSQGRRNWRQVPNFW